MNSHFDLIGAFVVKFIHYDQRQRLNEALESLAFTSYSVDLTEVNNQFDLFEQFYRILKLDEYCPNVPTGWDSVSDRLWQKVMFGNLVKLALRVHVPATKFGGLCELLFQLAEILVLLEQAVCKAREEEREIPLRLRMFIET